MTRTTVDPGPVPHRRALWVVVAAACVLGAAQTGLGLGAKAVDPKRLVLAVKDLPAGYSVWVARYYGTPASAASISSVPAKSFRAWGYVSGFERDLRKSGRLIEARTEPFEIDSLGSVYGSPSGARASFVDQVRDCTKNGRRLALPETIGDESVLCAFRGARPGSKRLMHYSVAWTRGGLKATVIVSGLGASTSPKVAVRLALKQDRILSEYR
jgi:hypothetical protein